MTPVRLEHAAPRSRVKHSNTVRHCFVVQYLVSFLVLHSSYWERESWLLYYSSWCCGWVCGAVGGSAVCDFGISWSYSLFDITSVSALECVLT